MQINDISNNVYYIRWFGIKNRNKGYVGNDIYLITERRNWSKDESKKVFNQRPFFKQYQLILLWILQLKVFIKAACTRSNDYSFRSILFWKINHKSSDSITSVNWKPFFEKIWRDENYVQMNVGYVCLLESNSLKFDLIVKKTMTLWQNLEIVLVFFKNI